MNYNVKKIRDILYEGIDLDFMARDGDKYKLNATGRAYVERSVPYKGRQLPGIPVAATMARRGSETVTAVLPLEKGTAAAVCETTTERTLKYEAPVVAA